ncbi:MAG: phenylacetate--CoA ligase family protein [Anaerolineae bacterium]|nr:phenylacetate--CoA ligase family protein [Anaerolineae bacterium]
MFDTLSYGRAFLQVMYDVGLSRRSLERLVSRRLRNVLESAFLHVPHYHELMRSINYDPRRDYNGPTDLEHFPLTTKKAIKDKGINAFLKEGVVLSRCFKDSTSGSTGVPLAVYRGNYERAVQIAKWLRVLFVNGYTVRDRVLALASPLRLSDRDSFIQQFGFLRRQAISYLLPPSEMVDQYLDYEPEVVYGNRTHLDLMAVELKRRNMQIKSSKLVFGGAEIIRDNSRLLCREAFGTEMLEVYGSVETGIMAYETRAHHGLHLNEDLTFFEFLDQQDNPVLPGQPGRVVVTDLMGDVMPFIRYDLGDLAIYEYRDSSDGSRWPRITRIIGREDDFAVLADGTRRSFHDFYEVMHQYEEIVQFRIVQKARDLFHILVVADSGYLLNIQDEIIRQLRAGFSPVIRFVIVPVDRIDPDPNGKIRMLISEVEDDA